jgi:hypothetical protein
MSDNPDEMPVGPDENLIAPDHELSVESVDRGDDQLKAALEASGKKPEGPDGEAEHYEATLAEQNDMRKRRPFIKGIGVVAATTVVVAGVSYAVIHRAHRQ